MIDITCGIVINRNAVLVTQKSEKMSLPQKWEFPGGKIELGSVALTRTE